MVESSSYRILLAEDEAINRMFAKRSMERVGHTVIEASNGVQAMVQLRVEEVDLVLLDIQMPKASGEEVLEKLRSGELGEHIVNLPVIALTAYGRDDDRERLFKLGVNSIVGKPFQAADLAIEIQRIMDEHNNR